VPHRASTRTHVGGLQDAVQAWCSDSAAATVTYGDINTWDVSLVTDMSYLLGHYSSDSTPDSSSGQSFNSDISQWNVSSVTNMKYMFRDATVFNQDLNQWDVSRVVNMNLMFAYAHAFNSDEEEEVGCTHS